MNNKISKKDITIIIGNVIDHFDTALYVFLAPIIAPVFFPNVDKIAGLITAYGILATSIITRPIGVYLFGMIARVSGIVCALYHSLIGVGIFTILIGLLPGYASLSIISPILFIIFRIAREICAAGEDSIAKLYILEGKRKQEAFKGSYLYETSTILGIILASFAATFIYYLNIPNLWRICHILGGSAAIIGYIVRKIILSDKILVLKNSYKFYSLSGLRILWDHKLIILKIMVVTSFSHMTYIIAFVTMNHIVPMVTNIEEKTMIAVNNFLLIFDLIAIPILGKAVSNYNPKEIMVTASTVLTLSIMPLWYFIVESNLFYIIILRLWIVIWGIIYICPLNIWCMHQVKGDKKYMIVGLGFALGSAIIGKLTPYICLVIMYYTGSYMPIAIYIMAVFLAAGLVIKSSNFIMN